MNILILCTGNSCRSQMAEAWLKQINPSLNVSSAGTEPAKEVHPLAVKVMKEAGLDISSNKPKLVDEFLDKDWDYVITVCDNAKETCPFFTGNAKNFLHYSFEDPSKAEGDDKFIWEEFNRISLEINHIFFFLNEKVFGKEGIICSNDECEGFEN
ncbi:MAG: arsenate reductase ArsC [Bacteroidales bacterium]|nr:arsenate reductase ArsC [Bacteroidales bacterium]